MKVIDNIRIVVIDNLNITWERYQEQDVGKKRKGVENDKRMAWVRLGGYYGTIERALESILNYVKRENVGNAEDLEKYLEEIKQIEFSIKVINKEDKKGE